jgi:transposase-like protein
MSSKPRRSFTAAQKAAILNRHHADKVPEPEVCEEAGIQLSLFHYWLRQRFDNADRAQQPPTTARKKEPLVRVEVLEAKLATKVMVPSRLLAIDLGRWGSSVPAVNASGLVGHTCSSHTTTRHRIGAWSRADGWSG